MRRGAVVLAAAALAQVGTAARAAADEAAADEIRRAVQSATLPIMATQAIPLADKAMARKALHELGRPRGFGDEWNPAVPEWKEAEAVLIAAPRPVRRVQGPGRPPEWPACLEQLSAEQLRRLAAAMASPLWNEALREIDHRQASFVLSMLALDDWVKVEHEQVSRSVAAAAPAPVGRDRRPPTAMLYAAAGSGEGADCLLGGGMLDIIARYGVRHQYDLPRDRAKPYLDRFEARNPQLRIAWLVASVKAGNRPRVEELLDAGVDVNGVVRTGRHPGETPLYAAAERGPDSLTMAKLLVDRGADVNARGPRGQTPLFPAVRSGNVEVVKLLLEKGADPKIRNTGGWDAASVLSPDSEMRRLLGATWPDSSGPRPQ